LTWSSTVYREIDYHIKDNSDRIVTKLNPYEALTILFERKDRGNDANDPIELLLENTPPGLFTESTVVAYCSIDEIPELDYNKIYKPIGITTDDIDGIVKLNRYDKTQTNNYWDYYPKTKTIKLVLASTAPDIVAVIIYKPTAITVYQDLTPRWSPYVESGFYLFDNDYYFYPLPTVQDEGVILTDNEITLHNLNMLKFFNPNIYGSSNFANLFDNIVDTTQEFTLLGNNINTQKPINIIVGNQWEFDEFVEDLEITIADIIDIFTYNDELRFVKANNIISDVNNNTLFTIDAGAGWEITSAEYRHNQLYYSAENLPNYKVSIVDFDAVGNQIAQWQSSRIEYPTTDQIHSTGLINNSSFAFVDGEVRILNNIPDGLVIDKTYDLQNFEQFDTSLEVSSGTFHVFYDTTIEDVCYYKDSLFVLVKCYHQPSAGIPHANTDAPNICFVAEFHNQDGTFINVGCQILEELITATRFTIFNDTMYVVGTGIVESSVSSVIAKYSITINKHRLFQTGEFCIKETIDIEKKIGKLSFLNTDLLYTEPSVGFDHIEDNIYHFNYIGSDPIDVYYKIKDAFKIIKNTDNIGNNSFDLVFSNPQTIFGAIYDSSGEKSTNMRTDPLLTGSRYLYVAGSNSTLPVTHIGLSANSNTLGDDIIISGRLTHNDTFISDRNVAISIYQISAIEVIENSEVTGYQYIFTELDPSNPNVVLKDLSGESNEHGSFSFVVETTLLSTDYHYMVVVSIDNVNAYELIISSSQVAPIIATSLYDAIAELLM